MAFVSIVASRYGVNSPASTDLFADMVGNLNYLYANQNAPSVAGIAPNVVNGSFELDVNNTVQPTGWLFTPGTGGSGNITNGQYNDGSQSFLFVQGTTAGNTAGTLQGPYNQSNATQQYYVVSPSKAYTLTFMILNNRADIANQVSVRWYSNTQAYLSSTTVLTQATGGANINLWQVVTSVVTPPAGAYYCTVYFNMGNNATTPPGATGNTWVDGISFSAYEAPQTGLAYSNVTQQFSSPAGISTIKVSCYCTGGYPPGTAIGYMAVQPTDNLTIASNSYITISGTTYYIYVLNNRTNQIIAASNNSTFIGYGGFINDNSSLLNLSVTPALITLEY